MCVRRLIDCKEKILQNLSMPTGLPSAKTNIRIMDKEKQNDPKCSQNPNANSHELLSTYAISGHAVGMILVTPTSVLQLLVDTGILWRALPSYRTYLSKFPAPIDSTMWLKLRFLSVQIALKRHENPWTISKNIFNISLSAMTCRNCDFASMYYSNLQ